MAQFMKIFFSKSNPLYSTHKCVHIWTGVCVCVCVCVCMWVCLCECIHTPMYICTQINLRIMEYVKIYCRIGTFNKHCSLDISTNALLKITLEVTLLLVINLKNLLSHQIKIIIKCSTYIVDIAYLYSNVHFNLFTY